jgi:hypothetical protein
MRKRQDWDATACSVAMNLNVAPPTQSDPLRAPGKDLSAQERLVICLGRIQKACQLQDMSNDFIFCENNLIRVFGGG